MASAIDPTKPEDGVPANKAELRANLAVARTELEHGGFAQGFTPAIYGVLLGAGNIRGPAAVTVAATAGTLVLKIVALGTLGLGIEAVALLNLVLVLPVMGVYMPAAGARLAGLSLWRFYRAAYLGPILAFLPVLGLGWLLRAELPPPGPFGFARCSPGSRASISGSRC